MKKRLISALFIVAMVISPVLGQEAHDDREAIKEVIDNETIYFASGEFEKWKTTWVHSSKALHTGASDIGFHKRKGWETIQASLKETIMDTVSQISRENLVMERRQFHYIIEEDMAWVYFMSTDNVNAEKRITDKMEARVLKKVDGDWRILYVNTIDISTYE